MDVSFNIKRYLDGVSPIREEHMFLGRNRNCQSMNGCAYCERALLAVNGPATHVYRANLVVRLLISISIALPAETAYATGR